MEQEKQDIEAKKLTAIFANNDFNLQAFKQVCSDQDYSNLIDFIETILRFFSLREKPGRTNPVSHLSDKQAYDFFNQLRKLKIRVQNTIYELKVEEIIRICRAKTSVKVPEATVETIQATTEKVNQLLKNPQNLDRQFKSPFFLFKYCVEQVVPLISKKILAINDHDTRYQTVLKSLKLMNKIFHPLELEVQISKNTLIETRVFRTNYEYEFLKKQRWAIHKLAPIVNQSLLCPSNIYIQELLFKILKRMYCLWGECVTGPLYLNLRNISLYSEESVHDNRILKQAAIFIYKIIKEKSDIKLCDMLQSSEDLKFIKQNQYFSSKAFAFPNELGKIYDSMNFELPFWEYWHWIENRAIWAYNVIIQKNNTMLSWKFWLKNYDIRFGIFKMAKCYHPQSSSEYESQKNCKQIVKMEKFAQPTQDRPVKGHLFLKPGLYHLVFDNTYSMMRGKDLYYQIVQLQSFT